MIAGLGANCFCLVCHSKSVWNFNLANNIKQWKLAKALIFHMRILSGMTFSIVTLTLELYLFFKKNFNFANNFRTVSARALIFHMNIHCDKILLLVLNIKTQTFDQFLKKKNWHWSYLLKNKILELPNCIFSFFVTKSFYSCYQNNCHYDHDHIWNWPLWGAFVFH